MNKLKLKYLAPYLPYDLKVYHEDHVAKIVSLDLPAIIKIDETDSDTWIVSMEDELDKELSCSVNYKEIKPILRPLSDLKKEIEHKGEIFTPIEYLDKLNAIDFFETTGYYNYLLNCISTPDKHYHIQFLPYGLIDKLFEWHFDVFGLIEKGLAVNMNDIYNINN